jgi:hypothetical protein
VTASLYRTGRHIDVRLYCRSVKGLLPMRRGGSTRTNDNDRICHLSDRPIKLRTSPKET